MEYLLQLTALVFTVMEGGASLIEITSANITEAGNTSGGEIQLQWQFTNTEGNKRGETEGLYLINTTNTLPLEGSAAVLTLPDSSLPYQQVLYIVRYYGTVDLKTLNVSTLRDCVSSQEAFCCETKSLPATAKDGGSLIDGPCVSILTSLVVERIEEFFTWQLSVEQTEVIQLKIFLRIGDGHTSFAWTSAYSENHHNTAWSVIGLTILCILLVMALTGVIVFYKYPDIKLKYITPKTEANAEARTEARKEERVKRGSYTEIVLRQDSHPYLGTLLRDPPPSPPTSCRPCANDTDSNSSISYEGPSMSIGDHKVFYSRGPANVMSSIRKEEDDSPVEWAPPIVRFGQIP